MVVGSKTMQDILASNFSHFSIGIEPQPRILCLQERPEVPWGG